MASNSILLIGASGQVGGALLTVVRKQFSSSPITVYLRAGALNSAVASLGNAKVVHGDFDTPEGLSTLQQLASQHDIVINAASSRFLDPNQAVLRGLTTYKAREGKNAILLHLSGAGNFSDNRTTGERHTTGEVAGLSLPFEDTDPAAVRKINAQHLPNGPSDEIIMAAAEQGNVNAYIVCPTGIYGASKDHIGLLADSDEGRKYARTPGVWVGWMLSNIQSLGFSPVIGPGESLFNTVHVDDVVSLTVLVLQKALRERDAGIVNNVFENFYMAAGDFHKTQKIAEVFATAAVKLALATPSEGRDSVEVKSVSYEQGGTTARYMAGDMLFKSLNGKKLGWEHSHRDFVQTLLS